MTEYNQELCSRLHKENDKEHGALGCSLKKKLEEKDFNVWKDGEFQDLKSWVSKIDARMWFILVLIVINIIVNIVLKK